MLSFYYNFYVRIYRDFNICYNLVAESLSKETSTQPCAICLTEPRNTALQCGHVLCWECAQRVDNCPVCRKFVSHRIRLFQ